MPEDTDYLRIRYFIFGDGEVSYFKEKEGVTSLVKKITESPQRVEQFLTIETDKPFSIVRFENQGIKHFVIDKVTIGKRHSIPLLPILIQGLPVIIPG